ncbi:F0F1 ATP synthase subunit A [Neobacillus massiliamazoniensis]|uniref:ATP synthase subunit a n=1 Tax=Neobacillus massiliamazoniensis TaxID=1499688 RepID=A0A0U1P016_9BACI|nr:F0F1 ATP synthase subunit A [Neobacillus massiliamazoniensis]CRK83587.1 ATP synthase F0 subunit A [Neobacillus massiliamazoniensis]
MEYSRPQVVFFHVTFDLSVLLTTTVTALIVFLFACLSTRKISLSTKNKWQNIMEWIVEFVQGIMHTSMGSTNHLFILATGVSLLMYLLIGNLLGVPLAIISTGENPVLWWKSPTADAHVTMTLAIMIMAYTHFIDVRLHGFKHYFSSYFKPFKALFAINILEELSTTLTLGLRLFGNIFAGEVMLAILASAVNKGILAAFFASMPLLIWQGFCIFIGVIQAYIFVALTMFYIGRRLSNVG